MKIEEVMEFVELIEDSLEEYDALNEKTGSLTPDIKRGRDSRKISRQFKRYGNKYERQYRCMSGPRKGRLVKNPQKCGVRKDPKQVRAGKKGSRIRKGQRVRKTKLAKRRPNSQTVQRWNKRLRGQN
jgi:hypothetical protein